MSGGTPSGRSPRAVWDERYAEPGFAYGIEPNEFLAEHAHLLHTPVLSLAEGEGRNAVWLAERGLDVTGVDASRVGLEKASGFAAARGVSIRTVVSDLSEYVIEPSAWGGIVSIWCHLPPPLRARVHTACVRGLRPGGVLVLEAYTPDQVALGTGGPRDPALCMTLDGLRAELAGLELIVGREIRRDVHEGKFHGGASATVQVVGRKPI